MRESEAFIRSLPLKRRFHDRNERRRYEIALVTAAKLIDDPTTLKNGSEYMERHMRADPAQARYYALWTDLISRDPKEIVRELLADTDHTVSQKYGSTMEYQGTVYAARHTFLIDPSGTIRKVYLEVKPSTHSDEVLADLQQLQATK